MLKSVNSALQQMYVTRWMEIVWWMTCAISRDFLPQFSRYWGKEKHTSLLFLTSPKNPSRLNLFQATNFDKELPGIINPSIQKYKGLGFFLWQKLERGKLIMYTSLDKNSLRELLVWTWSILGEKRLCDTQPENWANSQFLWHALSS